MVQIGTQTGSVINNIDHMNGDLNISGNTFNLSVQIHQVKEEILREVDNLTNTIVQNPSVPQDVKDVMSREGESLKQAVEGANETVKDDAFLSRFQNYSKILKEYTKTIMELAPTVKTLIAVGKGVGALLALTI